MTALRICAQCRHYRPSLRGGECLRRLEYDVDVVSGRRIEIGVRGARDERETTFGRFGARCGPKGQFFQQRSVA